MSLKHLLHWGELTQFAPHSGPPMTMAGTVGKVAILAILFFTGAFLSWKHFHARAQQIEHERMQIVAARTVTQINSAEDAQKVAAATERDILFQTDRRRLDCHYAVPFTRELSYPLFAWLLFFLGLGGVFFYPSRVRYLAPICILLQGIAFGSFEMVLHERFPGVTLLVLMLSAGLIFAVLAAFRIGLIDANSPAQVVIVASIGAVGFTYLATAVLRAFGQPVEFLHAERDHLGVVVMFLALETGLCVAAAQKIRDAIDSGAPKSLEWQAALRILVSFLEIARAGRRLLRRRSHRAW